jgi:hypothetical protein
MIAKIPPNRPNLITGPAAVCLAFLLSGAGGCVVERTTRTGAEIVPRAVRIDRAWAVELESRRVGRLELLSIGEAADVQTYYRVLHADGQLAGYIDQSGRAWRYEPFEQVLGRVRSQAPDASGQPIELTLSTDRNLVLVAMDTMAEDLRVLLELRRTPSLSEVAAGDFAAR